MPVMEVRLTWKPDWSAVVMDVSTAYDAFTTAAQKVTHGTVVQNLHPEGSIGLGLGLDLDFSSLSPSTSVRGAPHPMQEEGEKQKTEAKPENLEPTPEPKPTPTPAKVRYAKDGTPWPAEFNSWRNEDRLTWLAAHGWGNKQGKDGKTSWRKTPAAEAGKEKPHAHPPRSAPPPNPMIPCKNEPTCNAAAPARSIERVFPDGYCPDCVKHGWNLMPVVSAAQGISPITAADFDD